MNSATLQIAIEVTDNGSVKIRNLGKAAQEAGREGSRGFEQMKKSVDSTEASSTKLMNTVKAVAASLLTIQGAKQIIAIADSYTLLEGRLQLVTKSTQEFDAVQKQLYVSAQSTRTSYESTVDLYTRLARATKETGASQQELITVVEGVNKALIVSGASTTEANAALLQLGQGMASGVLRGEELNSVLEQTPRVAQMIADGLGISIGQLRKFGEEGKLTTDVVMKALISQTQAVNSEFARMPTTVGQAGNVLSNTLKSIVADANNSSGATAELAESILSVSSTVDANRENILSLFVNIVTAAGRAAEAIINIGNSIKGFAAVAAGALDFSKFASMNAAEFRKWVQDYDSGIAQIRDRLEEASSRLKAFREEDPALVDEAAFAQAQKEFEGLTKQLEQAEKAQGALANSAKIAADNQGGLNQISAQTGTALANIGKQASTSTTPLTNLGSSGSKSMRDLAKSAEDAEREIERVGRAMMDEAAKTREMTKILDDNAEEEKRSRAKDEVAILKESLQEQYGDAAEAVDKQMALEQEKIDFIRQQEEQLRSDIQSSMAGFVEGFLMGEFDSIEDAFSGLCDAILRAFVRMIAEMVAQWAMSGLVGLFSGEGFGGFSMPSFGGSGGSGSWGGSGGNSWGTAVIGAAPVAYDWLTDDNIGSGNYGYTDTYGYGSTGGEYNINNPYSGGINTSSQFDYSSQDAQNYGSAAFTGVKEGYNYLNPTVGAPSGMQALGGAAGVVGGAYGLYSAWDQFQNGTANAGTAVQAGMSAYSLYSGYNSLAAYYAAQQAATAGTAAIEAGTIVIQGVEGAPLLAATDSLAIGAQSGSVAASGTAAGAGSGAGGSAAGGIGAGGAGVIGAAAVIGGYIVATSPMFHEDTDRGGEAYTSLHGFMRDNPGGIPQESITAMADMFTKMQENWGTQWSEMARTLDATAPSFDNFIDTVTGTDVAIQDSTKAFELAQYAAANSGAGIDQLAALLESFGMSSAQAQDSAVAMVAAFGGIPSAAGSASAAIDSMSAAIGIVPPAASSSASALSDMIGQINQLSSTPLKIAIDVDMSGFNADYYGRTKEDIYGGGQSRSAHALGGIFDSPTLIPSINGGLHTVAEAGYPEAIIPLRSPNQMNEMQDDLAALKRMVAGLAGNSQPIVVKIEGDEKGLARFIKVKTDEHVAAKAQRGQLASRTVF